MFARRFASPSARRFARGSLTGSAFALALAGCAAPGAHVATSAPASASASARAPVEINLVAINDFHGNLEANNYNYRAPGSDKAVPIKAGGIPTLGGALDAWRRDDKDLLFVAAGDLVGASPALSSMWADEPTIEAMNRMGLVASSLGNHEFDQGARELLRQQRGGCDSPRAYKACKLGPDYQGAKFDYLAVNVVDQKTGRTLVPGYKIVDVKGVKVGLVGAVLQGTASVAVSSAIQGLTFLDEADSINKALPAMRAQGAQVFVVLIHEGGSTHDRYDAPGCANLKGAIVDIVKKLDPAIRLVISGHSHTGYLCQVDGRTVTQADAMGHLLTRIRMTVDPVSGHVDHIAARNVVMDPATIAPDAALADYLAQVRARSEAVLARPVGRIAAPSVSRKEDEDRESALGDLVADAAADATRGQGVQVGFMNPGGLRRDLEAGPDGVVRFGQAQAVLPFANTLVVFDLTGAQLVRALEEQWDRPAASGATMLQVSRDLAYEWDSTQPPGRRIVAGSVKVGGVPVDPAKTYRVVANNFLAEGGDNIPTFGQGVNRVDTKIVDLDTLIAYLNAHPETGAATGPTALAGQPRIRKVR